MTKLILRWAINAVALWVAVNGIPGVFNGVPGISGPRDWLSIIMLALIFGLVNALLRPLLNILTCPLIILTLGLGTLLINTLLFWLSGLIGQYFGVGLHGSAGLGRLLDGVPRRTGSVRRQRGADSLVER